ncbi:unnamed protein product [Owenia fusiformis]|uniref:DDB1- and CUL4-associated factor 1 n=1 Tax=Owenia fusiformis TaxID=6347 RepID=A0A8J1T507_OWEFU|nr:unnamed protein product [Owenia fusiformis]
MAAIDSAAELASTLEQWERDDGSAADPLPVLNKLADLIEHETEEYYKMDPDPFDDRHPGRADPSCRLGHLLKSLFKNDNFMNKLVSDYLVSSPRDKEALHIAACRLLFDIMPGLETTVIFQENEPLVRRLIGWAENAIEPLRSYATGLLSGSMEVQDVAANFKEANSRLVPMMITRLHDLIQQKQENPQKFAVDNQKQSTADSIKIPARPFAQFSKNESNDKLFESDTEDDTNSSFPGGKRRRLNSAKDHDGARLNIETVTSKEELDECSENRNDSLDIKSIKTSDSESVKMNCSIDEKIISNGEIPQMNVQSKANENSEQSDTSKSVDVSIVKRLARHKGSPTRAESIHMPYGSMSPFKQSPRHDVSVQECSNSSWAEMQPYVIGTYSMSPLTCDMQQRLILKYLTPMGEYQELLTHVFEKKAMDLIFYYIDLSKNRDVRLAFEALKYLASLLCHKKFTVEFINLGGVQKLLQVYRPSVAATGVSMCLYYLAYFEDAMERVCLLPHHILSDLVNYVLWLLECSHESGRCHATMFFSTSFMFRVIIELFDMKDGLRKLYNVISTLEILIVDDQDTMITEDAIFTSRQAARHVCVALKRYFEAHLSIKADIVRRSLARDTGAQHVSETPPFKAAKFSSQTVQDNIELLLDNLPVRAHWKPVDDLLKLGGVKLLVQLIALTPEWNAYTGKAETIRSALDVLAVCTVMPRAQLCLCDSVPVPENLTTPAISVLLGVAEGEIIPDPDVQKAALNVIMNCVCGPITRYSSGMGKYQCLSSGGSARRRSSLKADGNVLASVWEAFRSNNGIMVLLKLLHTRSPITHADSIRALACKALMGLARNEMVRQIISKLPLYNNGQLQLLMKEPVLHDKRAEHVKFCKYANVVLERVSGKPQNADFAATLEQIRKDDVVAQTRIIYREKELLQLMHDHLLQKGYSETASALQREADLPAPVSPPIQHPSSPHIYSTPAPSTPKLNRLAVTPRSTPTASQGSQSTLRSSPGSSIGTPGSIKVNIISHKTPVSNINAKVQPSKQKMYFRQKSEIASNIKFNSQLSSRHRHTSSQQSYSISLDKIVTSYLRRQHMMCSNPVGTCPPFSLLEPHRCPEPKRRSCAPENVTSRCYRRQYFPKYGGFEGRRWNRKYVYSRFRPVRSYRDAEEDGCFTCCTFSTCEQFLMLGTYAGELKMYNLQTAEESAAYVCHSSPLTHVEHSRDTRLALTSSSWSRPLSGLWTMTDMFEMKHTFEEDSYAEFSKQTQDRIVATKEETAHIYDVETGRCLQTFFDQDKANNYVSNRATFSPTDDLVLNDGVLWDVNSGKLIQKFDKFNPNISGVFHPMGLEIIINSEVWDLRSYHLLHTVPALDQCRIRFNQAGDVIYGAIHQLEDDDDREEEKIKSPYGSTFRTFDANDYSNIATIDVKKNIFDMCTDVSDCYLAVIENSKNEETLSEESICHLYEVGRNKDAEDDQEEDEEDEEEEEDDVLDDEDGSDNDDNNEDDDDDDDENNDDQIEDNSSDSDSSDSDSDESLDLNNIPDDDDDDDDILFELSNSSF